MKAKGLFIVISGPSGAGKGSVIAALREKMPRLKKSVSVTTRAPRPGEVEGVHYYFRDLNRYRQMIADGEFFETAEVYTNFYGTPKESLLKELNAGFDVIGELDTLGARQVKSSYPESVRIYILPPGLDNLRERLVKRGTERGEVLERRISAARKELEQYTTYNYIVVNDEVEKAATRIAEIIGAEKSAVQRNAELIDKYLKS